MSMHDTAREHDELAFGVMGTDAHVIVVRGPLGLCKQAAARLASLEATWSRFRPDSELSRLNAAAGRPVVVSELTYAVIARAVDAWERSGGAFDPTVLPALAASGYDRDYATMDHEARIAEAQAGSGHPLPPGAGVVELDPIVRAVRLPGGVALDLGGIAKGVAADLVVAEMRASGAEGACVNIGGDLRVSGASPSGPAWAVEIEREPGPAASGAAPGVAVLVDGGIATSSCRRRVWRRGSEQRHHIIDPRTGRSAHLRWSSVTAIAGCAGDAEPAATAALMSPDAAHATTALGAFGAVGLAFDQTGRAHELGAIGPFLAAMA
jgi:thiamine biosynthesis lipoprotein